jgi:hypothetical protein
MSENNVRQGLIDDLLSQLETAKLVKANAEAEIAEATYNLVGIAKMMESKTIDSKYLGKKHKITVVTSERIKYDADAIENALGEEQWEQATTRKLDTDKLKQTISNGQIQLESIADFIQVKKSNPHLRVSTSPQ